MTPHVYRYPIRAASFYDGDSMDLTLDLGFALVLHRKCRLQGVDTPELRGGTEASRAAGRLARDVAQAFVASAGDAAFVSETWTGKFGRPLGDIETSAGSLREKLIEGRYAVPYHGGAKADVAELHAENLAALVARGELGVP